MSACGGRGGSGSCALTGRRGHKLPDWACAVAERAVALRRFFLEPTGRPAGWLDANCAQMDSEKEKSDDKPRLRDKPEEKEEEQWQQWQWPNSNSGGT